MPDLCISVQAQPSMLLSSAREPLAVLVGAMLVLAPCMCVCCMYAEVCPALSRSTEVGCEHANRERERSDLRTNPAESRSTELGCEHANRERERSDLRTNPAEKKRKQRGPRRQLMPTDFCAPIRTPAEEALYWLLYHDPAFKNHDGSDNFLLMASQFNQQWSKQVGACAPVLSWHF